jgi:lipopolysaccharide/colanic/teichoic acid biosynthesis glycosyltransferase
MVHATIREEIASGRVSASRRVPERLSTVWTTVLIAADAMAALSACYIAGFPATAGPAATVILSAALAACGIYQRSYAVRWYDEAYAVVVAVALAFVPSWLLLHAVSDIPVGQVVLALALAALFIATLHCALHRARHDGSEPAEAIAAYVSPEAQWKTRHGAYPIWKRTFDLVLAAAGIVLVSPILLLAAVCIAIESGFPILFRQERIGRGGTPFVMYKFRTMWQDAGPDWVRRGDRRVTNVGALLRAGSIDELPQLFNVIRGDMSLVGPRPEMPQFARDFQRTIRNYGDRSIVPPGLTGWAQVYCKRNLTPNDMPDVVPYDLFYVEHASPLVDAVVVVKTAVEFLVHRGV